MRGMFFFLMTLFFLSFSTANFACGFLNDSKEHHAYWVDVTTYYNTNSLKNTSCVVSPENKYCCDMQEIKGVPWAVGKKIVADVFDIEKGLVAGPVNTTISGQGIDLFPGMVLEEAISIGPHKKILIGEENVSINVTINSRFQNLRYELISEEGSSEEVLCEGCNPTTLVSLNLDRGKNVVKFTASGNKEISKEITFYSLDYLNLNREIFCEGCSSSQKVYRVKSSSNVLIRLTLNSSHNVSGLLNDYFPIEWEMNDSNEGLTNSFSETHESITFEIKNETDFGTFEYVLDSPRSIIPRKFEFISSFEGQEFVGEVIVTLFPRILDFLNLPKKIKKNSLDFDFKKQTISSGKPLINLINGPTLDVLALYSEEEAEDAYLLIEELNQGYFNEAKKYSVKTNVYNEDVEKFVVRYKVPVGFSHEVIQGGFEFEKNLLKSDDKFDYYEVTFNNKEDFIIRSNGPDDFFSEIKISFARFASWVFPNDGRKFGNCLQHFSVFCNFRDYFDSGGFLDIFRIYSREKSSFFI